MENPRTQKTAGPYHFWVEDTILKKNLNKLLFEMSSLK